MSVKTFNNSYGCRENIIVMTLSGRNERGVCVRTVHETNLPWEISIGKEEKALKLFIYFNMKPPFFKTGFFARYKLGRRGLMFVVSCGAKK